MNTYGVRAITAYFASIYTSLYVAHTCNSQCEKHTQIINIFIAAVYRKVADTRRAGSRRLMNARPMSYGTDSR